MTCVLIGQLYDVRPDWPAVCCMHPDWPAVCYVRPDWPAACYVHPDWPAVCYMRPDWPAVCHMRPDWPAVCYARPDWLQVIQQLDTRLTSLIAMTDDLDKFDGDLSSFNGWLEGADDKMAAVKRSVADGDDLDDIQRTFEVRGARNEKNLWRPDQGF